MSSFKQSNARSAVFCGPLNWMYVLSCTATRRCFHSCSQAVRSNSSASRSSKCLPSDGAAVGSPIMHLARCGRHDTYTLVLAVPWCKIEASNLTMLKYAYADLLATLCCQNSAYMNLTPVLHSWEILAVRVALLFS